MKFTLDEIPDWKTFEDMIAEYFRRIQKFDENSLTEVTVEASGEGSDGGRDILLSFRINDSITKYNRKWVVQCKFLNRSLNKADISSVNIPTLIHEYRAEGYLLVCKKGVTSKVSEMFERLRENCKFDYNYEFWDGSELISKLLVVSDLFPQYFPQYDSYKRSEKQEKNKPL